MANGTFPVVAAGVYDVQIRLRVGGSAAFTDPVVFSGVIQWDGTREVPLGTVLPAAVAGASGGLSIVGSAMTLTSAYDAAKTAVAAGGAMTLTSGERTAIGVAVRDTSNASPAGASIGRDISAPPE